MSLSNPLKSLAIPASRHAQLQDLARARNCSIADIIGQTIKDAIARREIPDTTPGLTITRAEGIVRLQRERKTVSVTPQVAIAAATKIERCVSAKGNGESNQGQDENGLQGVTVRCHGHALIVRFTGQEFEIALSASVATDVARQLRAAACQSDPQRDEPSPQRDEPSSIYAATV